MPLASIISSARNTLDRDIHRVTSGAQAGLNSVTSHLEHAASQGIDDIRQAENAIVRTGHNITNEIGHDVSSLAASGRGVLERAEAAGENVLEGAHRFVEETPARLSEVANYIGGGIRSGADLISDIEGKILPSPAAVIGESALVVGGIAIVAIVLLKFL
jgi:hypothetical protein